jgi:hypothetical protein
MRFAILAAAVVLGTAFAATAAARSAHFQIGAQVVSSARLVTRTTADGVAMDSRSFGGEAHALLVEQRTGAAVSLKSASGAVSVPREGGAPLLVRAAGELAFAAAGPAEIVVTLLADGLPPPLDQKLNVTVIRSR